MKNLRKPFIACLIAFVVVGLSSAYLIVLAPQSDSQRAENRRENGEIAIVTMPRDDEGEDEEISYEPQASTEDGDRQSPILIEYGHGVTRSLDSFAVYIGFLLYNPNDDIAINFPGVRYTARAADNSILGTDDQILGAIYPGQTMAWGFLGFLVDEEPASVEFEVIPPDDWNWVNPQVLDIPEYVTLDVSNVSQRDSSFTGEVINPSDFDVDSVTVTIIFRDENGEIVGGGSTFLSGLAANGSLPFEIGLIPDEIITEDYEIFATIRVL